MSAVPFCREAIDVIQGLESAGASGSYFFCRSAIAALEVVGLRNCLLEDDDGDLWRPAGAKVCGCSCGCCGRLCGCVERQARCQRGYGSEGTFHEDRILLEIPGRPCARTSLCLLSNLYSSFSFGGSAIGGRGKKTRTETSAGTSKDYMDGSEAGSIQAGDGGIRDSTNNFRSNRLRIEHPSPFLDGGQRPRNACTGELEPDLAKSVKGPLVGNKGKRLPATGSRA